MLWLVTIPLLLLGLGWYLKEIVISFIETFCNMLAEVFARIFTKPKQEPDGECVYSIYRNSDDKLVVYTYATDSERVLENNTPDNNTGNIVLLPTIQKPRDESHEEEPEEPPMP